jgi:hypothetical protein
VRDLIQRAFFRARFKIPLLSRTLQVARSRDGYRVVPRTTLQNSPQGGERMTSLEDLARKKFPDLSEAEKGVVQAAPNGNVADCHRDLGGGDDPANADGTPEAPDVKWPEARNVRGDLIRWLCVDREAREQVDPRGVRIGGARITGRLDLSSTNVLFPLVLFACRLEQDLLLNWSKMPLLSLEGSWTAAIVADGLNVEGGVFLRNRYHAEGEVRLLGATIGGDLNAQGGTFTNPGGYALHADGIEVHGSVSLRDKFAAAGEVRLLGATIGRDLEARGGTFKNSNGVALNAASTNVHGNVSLRGKFVAEGEVRLYGAEVNGQLTVVDGWLDGLNLENAQITGPFQWRDIQIDPHPDFPEKEWKPALNLTNAKVGALADEEASWPEEGRLFLDGFVYDRVAGGLADTNAPTDAKARLRWVRLQPEWLGFRPQPYEQFIAVLRQMGHEHHVAKVAMAKQKDLRKRGHLGLLGWMRSWFLYLAVGYGYRAWLAFIWLFLLIVLGSCVFSNAHSANVLVPSDKDAYAQYENSEMQKPPPYYPNFHAPFYSLDVVLPFDLGQKSSWRLIERWPGDRAYWGYEFYSIVQLFLGWVLLLVAAAVPAGFIKKD